MRLGNAFGVFTKSTSVPSVEDEDPLLYDYYSEVYPPHIVRSRTMSKGAAAVLGRWPDHVSVNWFFAFVGLVSILICFLLCVLLVITTTTPSHHGKKFVINQCKNQHETAKLFQGNTLDHLDERHSIYIVEIPGRNNDSISSETSCGIESLVSKTSYPVYYIRITLTNEPEKKIFPTSSALEKKYKNLKTISMPLNELLKRTIFEKDNYFDPTTAKHLPLLVKVLISWNFGGLVIDSKLITIKPYEENLLTNNVVIGISKNEIVLIDTKRYCHSYIFELMKVLTERRCSDLTESEIAEIALKRFNNGREGHNGVDLISDQDLFCTTSVTDKCVFLNSKYCNDSRWMNECF